MNVQPYQLIFLFFYALLAWIFWKIKIKKVRVLIVCLIFVSIFVNPIRFKQEGGSKLERNITRFDKVPDKVIVDKWKFEDNQSNNMSELKKQSEDLKDEIHD